MSRTRLATGAINKRSFVDSPRGVWNNGDETQHSGTPTKKAVIVNLDPFRHVVLGNGQEVDECDTLYNRAIQACWSRYERTGHKEKRGVVEKCIETMRSAGVIFLRRNGKEYVLVEPHDRNEQTSIHGKVRRRLRTEVLLRTKHLTDEDKLWRAEVFKNARKAKRNLEEFQQNKSNQPPLSVIPFPFVYPQMQRQGARTICCEEKQAQDVPLTKGLEEVTALSSPIALATKPSTNYLLERPQKQQKQGQRVQHAIVPPLAKPVVAKKLRAENLVPLAPSSPASLAPWNASSGHQVTGTVNPFLEAVLIGLPTGVRSMKIPVPLYLTANNKFPVSLDELKTEFFATFRSLHEFTVASNDWDGFSVQYSAYHPQGLIVYGRAKVVNMVVEELEDYLQDKAMMHNFHALQSLGSAVDVEVDATHPLGATLGGPDGETDVICISTIHAGGELANAIGKQHCISHSPCAILEAVEGIKCQNVDLFKALKDAAVSRGQQTVSLQLRLMPMDKRSLLCLAPPKLRLTLTSVERNGHYAKTGMVVASRSAQKQRTSALREDPASGGFWMDGVFHSRRPPQNLLLQTDDPKRSK